MNARHVCKGSGQRSAWLRVLPLPHSSGCGTGRASGRFPLLQHAWLEGSSLRPTAAPPPRAPSAVARHWCGALPAERAWSRIVPQKQGAPTPVPPRAQAGEEMRERVSFSWGQP